MREPCEVGVGYLRVLLLIELESISELRQSIAHFHETVVLIYYNSVKQSNHHAQVD